MRGKRRILFETEVLKDRKEKLKKEKGHSFGNA